MSQYIVLDLEMCKVNKNYRRKEYSFRNEIIQIGAVKLNESFDMIDEFNSFVRPEYGRIDNFIKNLTGIPERMVKNAPILKDALRLFLDWIGDLEDVKLMAWSNSDYNQLKNEIISKKLEDETILALLNSKLWVDYQQQFVKRYEIGRTISLTEALDLVDVDTEGHIHNGLDDAINTAKLISKLEKNPDYELPIRLMGVREEVTEALSFSLGDLFSADFLKDLED